ncbi:pimeloyl-ACP methyl ester carboxylesterase [Mumia flava]|uniref:Pimeloyl-ACP methyl ester carboxylesterase n=1 Tax=Mumia flava TaxID=1348852 RepID=A0A0B2BPZ7_9ACTN|nr:alpha/beta hydrolase [Mumia flava]PJJ56604.1 pimeloyl-ACP methyl ester carboxylesterase [Mumia flava]
MTARVVHRTLAVGDVRVFFRESVPDRAGAPTLLLLHGFPSASHQFRRLLDVLGSRYRLVAPDYPGFGHTQTPDGFSFTFDHLAEVVDAFVTAIGLERFALYVFDFGAPVGFRLAQRRAAQITGLIVQNGNAYEEGLSAGARDFIALRPDTPGATDTIADLLTLSGTRSQYVTGVTRPELLAPDSWILDQYFLEQPGRVRAQIAIAFDYHANVERYPRWQSWLRTHRPATLIVWGADDPFFPAPGATAYLRDLPDAELHLFRTGHFALEDHLEEIAPLVADFLDRLRP